MEECMDDKIYIAVLHYKTIEKTKKCIQSILNISSKYHILVIDNNSGDGTLEALKDTYKDKKNIEFLPIEKNIGFARANNRALEVLRKKRVKYAILSNNDIIFKQNSIEGMINVLKSDQEIAVATPRVRDPQNNIQNTTASIKKSILTILFGRLNVFANRSKRSASYDYPSEVKQFHGCCFACNLDRMKDMNDFDPFTFLYYEEAILEEKINSNKFKIYYVPQAEVIHEHGATTNTVFNYKIHGYLMESELYYLRKYRHVNKRVLTCSYKLKVKRHMYMYHSEELRNMELEIIHNMEENKFFVFSNKL